MARPRDPKKRRWTSRRYAIGFIEDYRERGVCYARIGDWRKTLAPLKFVSSNRAAAVAILERLIDVGAHKVPPSRVLVSASGDVSIQNEPEVSASTQSFLRHARTYRLRREAEGVSDSWRSVFRYALLALIGEQDVPLDAHRLRSLISHRFSSSDLSPKSLEVYLGILSGCMADAVRGQLLAFNPIESFNVQVPQRPIEIYTPEEEREILAAIDSPRNRDYFRLLRLAALRRKEAFQLLTGDLQDLGSGRRVLRIQGKGGRTRLLPIAAPDPDLSGPVADWSRELEQLISDLVKEPAYGDRLFDWSNDNSPTSYLRRVRKRIGHSLPDGRAVHTFRKGALSDWKMTLHLDESIINAWAGNTRSIREKHYYRPTDARDALASLDAVLR